MCEGAVVGLVQSLDWPTEAGDEQPKRQQKRWSEVEDMVVNGEGCVVRTDGRRLTRALPDTW